MKPLAPALLTLCLCSQPALSADTGGEEEGPLFQAFLGVLELDDQTGEWDEISDGDVDVDFSSLPSGGVEGEYAYYRGWVHAGLNPGGSIAWKNDDTSFSGGFTEETGGVLRVDVDNSLFLFELHLGAYVRGRLSDRITAYAAGGPMVIYGSHEVDDDEPEVTPAAQNNGTVVITEEDSNDINLGYYARAGIDFEISDRQHLGLGFRYMSAELDFNDTVGKLDIEGPQYVLTFTQQY